MSQHGAQPFVRKHLETPAKHGRTPFRKCSRFPLFFLGCPPSPEFFGIFWEIICPGRELQRPKLNHVHPAFSCFCCIFHPPKKSWKSKVSSSSSKPCPLGPCPDDRAQHSVQDSLIESSVRPNPTLVCSKIRSQFYPWGRYFGKVFWEGIFG